MNNILLSCTYLLLTFFITILCYKKYGKYGLYIWMCVSVIICNIQTIKMTEILGLTISLGNISYGAIFLCTDILSEKYGIKATKTGINLSLITMIVFTILMQLFLLYDPSLIDNSQKSLIALFSYMPRITIASLLAYYISQLVDAKLYQIVKKKYNKIWLSNNISTIISQTIDTLIFVLISFIGVVSVPNILELILTMIIFKFIIAILDTPFMLLITKINCKEID